VTTDRFQAVQERGGCVDLSARAKFRLTGADRVRYLNGQVTNDARKATKDTALHACVVNAKGRIEAEVFIHVSLDGEALMLDTEAGLRETIGARLERYIVADDVTLEDVTEEWSILHVFGPEGAQDAPRADSWMQVSRFGCPGAELWSAPGGATVRASAPYLVPDEVEILRIVRGIPRWPQELNPDAFPQEAGLEADVMDFAKGCYIGQEVLSRIKMSGKMPRVLRRFEASGSGLQVEQGMKLLAGGDVATAKEAGVITSVTRHPLLDRWVGLAYVRQAFEAADSLLLANGDPPRLLGDVKIAPS
jgi:folate-binding protein YgfZ